MIRGLRASLVIAALLLCLASTASFEKIEITKVHRLINLSGNYAGENIRISFVANEDGIDQFTYFVPYEYDTRISKIWFTRSEKDKTSLSYSKSIYTYVTRASFRRVRPMRSTEWHCPTTIK